MLLFQINAILLKKWYVSQYAQNVFPLFYIYYF